MKALTCGLILIFLLAGAGLAAQGIPSQEKLQARFSQLTLFPRANGPLMVDVTLVWAGRELLEGCLTLTLRTFEGSLFTYRCDSIAMLAGEQRFRYLLPSFNYGRQETDVDLLVSFNADDGRKYSLPSQKLKINPFNKWIFTVGLCTDQMWENKVRAALANSFSLEVLEPGDRRPRESVLSTFAQSLKPDDIGIDPLDLCIFDILVLHGKAFESLKEKQLDGLAAWVLGGGSLCVFPQGRLKPYHLAFLNRVCRVRKFEDPYSLDARGRLVSAAASAGPRRLFFSELGRTVVVSDPAFFQPDWKKTEWRQAVLFLWKIRYSQLADIMRAGTWSEPPQETNQQTQNAQQVFKPLPLDCSNIINSFMLSKEIRIIPFGLVMVLLAILVGLIGPFDYLFLGWLRRRRLTWVTFPVICILFSLLMIQLSNYYLGSKDYWRRVTVIDVDAQARPLRKSQFMMAFTASDRDLSQDLRGQLVCRIDHQRFGQNSYGYEYDYYGNYNAYGSQYYGYDYETPGRRTKPLTYEGRVPGNYQLHQEFDKWTPQMNRYFGFSEPDAEDEINYKAQRVLALTPKGDFDQFMTALKAASRDLDLFAALLYKDTFRYLPSRPEAVSRMARAVDLDWLLKLCSRPEIAPSQARNVHGESMAPSINLFGLVSGISPNGSADFTDLALLDAGDPRQAVLIVMEIKDDEILIYRRLIIEEK